jgi:hypothetical protein
MTMNSLSKEQQKTVVLGDGFQRHLNCLGKSAELSRAIAKVEEAIHLALRHLAKERVSCEP